VLQKRKTTKKNFPVVCTWTLCMVPLEAFCALAPLLPRPSLVYSPEQYKCSLSLSEFLHHCLWDWAAHNLRSLRMMTLFISCSLRMPEIFASVEPDCQFFCNRILEGDFLWYLVSFFFGLFMICFLGRSRQKAAVPFRECSSFVGCSCFLRKISGTWLMSEDRTITVVFSEAGGLTVG